MGALIPVPEHAYHPRKKQYDSTEILQALEPAMRDRDEIFLGIIDEDLFVPGLNFVFGQADTLSRVAVTALPRLRQEFYGSEPDSNLFLMRGVKEAIHELGHAAVGLSHCPDSRCVMHFSNSLPDTDFKDAAFCSACGIRFRSFTRSRSGRSSSG